MEYILFPGGRPAVAWALKPDLRHSQLRYGPVIPRSPRVHAMLCHGRARNAALGNTLIHFRGNAGPTGTGPTPRMGFRGITGSVTYGGNRPSRSQLRHMAAPRATIRHSAKTDSRRRAPICARKTPPGPGKRRPPGPRHAWASGVLPTCGQTEKR
jgi:hypothetical protein